MTLPSDDDSSASSSPAAPDHEATAPAQTSSEAQGSSHPSSALTPAEVESRCYGAGGRALLLIALLGMALVTWVFLGFSPGLRTDLLSTNTIDVKVRLTLLLGMVGASLFGILILLFLFWRKTPRAPEAQVAYVERVEAWAWFLSPLLLLPAIPVFQSHAVWFEQHEKLLPIALFFGLLVEFFTFQSLRHLPPSVAQALSLPLLPKFRGRTWLERHGWLTAVLLLATGYSLFMSFYTVRWHNLLGTATFDLGINNNLIYGGLHGKINQSTVLFPDDPQKYVANHLKLGLYAYLPLYVFYPKPETLLVIQSFSLGFGSLPLFLFARRRIPEWIAAILALAYLCYYPMHGANFYEVQLPCTASVLVLTTIWAMDAQHLKTGWVFFFLSLIAREDIPIPLAVIGLVFAVSGHRPKIGLTMFLISSTWFVLVRFKVMQDAGSWWFPNMYEDLWAPPYKGFGAVLHTLITNPTYVLKHIFVEKKFWYLMHLMTPLLFLPARRWYLWAAFLPGAILTLLVTNYNPPVMFSFQYVMHWAPYLFIAAALAIHALGVDTTKLLGSVRIGRSRQAASALAIALVSVALTYNYGAFPTRENTLHAGYHRIRFTWTPDDQTRIDHVRKIVAMIPAEASVATTERVGAHLSSRVKFYTLRRGHHNVDYIVAQESGLRLDRTKQSLFDALSSQQYGVLLRLGEFAVLKRGADTARNDELISDWRLASGRSKSKKPKRATTKSLEQRPEPPIGAAEPSSEDERPVLE